MDIRVRVCALIVITFHLYINARILINGRITFFLLYASEVAAVCCVSAGHICQAARIRRGHLGIDDSIKILYVKHGIQLDPLAHTSV